MEDTQIIFRVDKSTLRALDQALSHEGFKTRNEWFRFQVRRFLEDSKKKQLEQRLERLTIEGIREEDTVAMVREWRVKKAKR